MCHTASLQDTLERNQALKSQTCCHWLAPAPTGRPPARSSPTLLTRGLTWPRAAISQTRSRSCRSTPRTGRWRRGHHYMARWRPAQTISLLPYRGE
ncbi:hypothetical protein FQN60_004474 [Etheostoma spectabile]|uniref:Uncharacterized protein n=1 Tax=Etheostoma spectabile TaxID=54343 RepID=A0A5J5CYU2_9PERO|nr:hypothetical protein FQN60_004474 [Etheostoma spectabile]